MLRASQNAEFKLALAALQREAGTNMAKTYELSMWEMARISPAETLAWIRSLPMNTQTNQPVALVVAECQTMLGNWKALQTSLETQNWAELEFMRRAFKTRAQRSQDLTGAAKGKWELALKAANGQRASLAMLLRLAVAWDWQTEAEEILWTIVNKYPDDKGVSTVMTSKTLTAAALTARPPPRSRSTRERTSPPAWWAAGDSTRAAGPPPTIPRPTAHPIMAR